MGNYWALRKTDSRTIRIIRHHLENGKGWETYSDVQAGELLVIQVQFLLRENFIVKVYKYIKVRKNTTGWNLIKKRKNVIFRRFKCVCFVVVIFLAIFVVLVLPYAVRYLSIELYPCSPSSLMVFDNVIPIIQAILIIYSPSPMPFLSNEQQ